ncbi:MAG TPA: hypothetical protein VE954_00705 [Oligoflexus sp.]|uniref:hypothetical protein n=1 Tax=Oligoflexus sp. TaxID=1971216 RepID=UPI002D3CAD80|nr:hypothetical protein [Oligoflexus sp.]HYX31599.1 hypothetical protein [Oligoflexus sp.]
MRFAAILLSTIVCSTALAEKGVEYRGTERAYSSDEVIAILGKMKSYPAGKAQNMGVNFQAGVRSKLKCGNIRFDTNFQEILDQVNQLPGELKKQFKNLLPAAPMLALCYTSPTGCAEIKNLNLRLDQELRLLTDTCKSIDDYVTSTAEKGEIDGRKRSMQDCISSAVNGGKSLAKAVSGCEANPPGGKYIDIANAWLKETFTTNPQNFLEAAMNASGESTGNAIGQENYAFLSSVMGETKILSGGKSVPVFPKGSQKTSTLASNLFGKGAAIACDRNKLSNIINGSYTFSASTDDERYNERKLVEVTQAKIDKTDHDNLFDLDTPDRAHACQSLGRSLGKEAMLLAAKEGEALAIKAIQNPLIPAELRQTYEQRINQVFPAMRESAATEQVKSVDELRRLIAILAKKQRQDRRLAAKSLSRGEISMDSLRTDSYEECDSDITCSE